MSLDKVWFSLIDYRPDPSAPGREKLALGAIVAAQLGRGYDLTLAARKELTESELKTMDGIARELLHDPASYFKNELHRLLKTSSIRDGAILSALAQLHRWSLHVTAPQRIRVERHLSQTNHEALTSVCQDLLVAHLLDRTVPLTSRLRAKRLIPEDWRAELPTAWQLTTSSFAPPAFSP